MKRAKNVKSTNRADSLEAARAQLQKTIDDGSAREKFAQMVAAQGGDLEVS